MNNDPFNRRLVPVERMSPASHYIRCLISKALSENLDDGASVARKQWPHFFDEIQKAASSAMTSGELLPESPAAAFFSGVYDQMAFRQIPGMLRMRFYEHCLSSDDAAIADWIPAFKHLPVTRVNVAGKSLERLKTGGIEVYPRVALEYTQTAVDWLLSDLAGTTAASVNTAFLDPDNAGVAGERPSSITSQGEVIASSGSPDTDLEAMVNAFSKSADMGRAVIVSDAHTFTTLSNARDSNGSYFFSDLGPRGGFIRGVPAIALKTSEQTSNSGNLTLIDGGSVAFALDGMDITSSRVADLVMDDLVDSNNEQDLITLFQSESIAFKSIAYCNWHLARPNACVTVTNCAY